MTRPQRHPRRPARPRPRPRSSISKRAQSCSTRRSSSWPPSTWRRPIVIGTSSDPTSARCSTRTCGSWPRSSRSTAGGGHAGRRGPAQAGRGGRPVAAAPVRPPPRRRPWPRPRSRPPRPRRPWPPARPRPSSAAAGCSTRGASSSCKGNYDAAQQKADEARTLDVHWGLFDDTPEKLEQEIIKARPQYTPAVGGAEANLPHDRRTAKLKLQRGPHAAR